MNYKHLIIAMSILPVVSLAQEEKDFVYKTEAVIDLEKADRPFEKVTKVPQVKTEVAQQTYEPKEIAVELPDIKSKIRIYPVGQEPITPLNNSYVKLGFGNFTTPLVDAFLNSGRNDQMAYGMRYKHQSSTKGPVDGKNSGSAYNLLSAYGKWFGDQADYRVDASFERLGYYFYGYEPGIEVNRDSLKQRLNRFNVNLGVNNIKTENDLTYDLNVGFSSVSDKLEASETQFDVHLMPRYRFSGENHVSLQTDMYWATQNDSSKIGRSMYSFKPHFNHRAEKWRYTVGANVAYENDTLEENKKFHFYPKLFLQYEWMENVQPYAGLEGDMERNTLNGLLDENPYLASNQVVYNTNNTMKIFIGAEGTFKKKLYYNLRLQHDNYERFYTFINDSSNSKFQTLYDGGNVRQLTFSADVCYTLEEYLKIGLKSSFFGYVTDTLEEAWHMPKMSSNLYFRYILKDKIFINADFYYISGIVAKDFSNNSAVTLNGIFDINLKLEYLLSDKLSVFAEGKNLVSKNYELYYGYPVRGINYLFGLTYSF